MNYPKSKSEAYALLLDGFDDILGNRGCNDFTVENTKEMYDLIEGSAVRNLRLKSVDEFRRHPEYESYKPEISKDGKWIYTQDFTILECLRNEVDVLTEITES